MLSYLQCTVIFCSKVSDLTWKKLTNYMYIFCRVRIYNKGLSGSQECKHLRCGSSMLTLRDQSSPVIKGLRFNKIKSKGFMVYSNALICLLSKKILGKLSEIYRFSCGPSEPISMDHFFFKIQINYNNMHIKLKIRTNVIY